MQLTVKEEDVTFVDYLCQFRQMRSLSAGAVDKKLSPQCIISNNPSHSS